MECYGNQIKRGKRKLQDRISHISRNLEDAKDVLTQFEKSLDETKRKCKNKT